MGEIEEDPFAFRGNMGRPETKEEWETFWRLKTDWENDKKKKEQDKFLEKYNSFSTKEKVEYWAKDLLDKMRSQQERCQSPYYAYSEYLLKEALKIEPDFMNMLPLIYDTWGDMFDSAKLDKVIQIYYKWIKRNNE